ncbi:hypothetical protein ACOMHN_031079 [Nucella lapillus]
MATAGVSYPRGVPEIFHSMGISTKGLHCDDPIAKMIDPDFVDRVDPMKLIMFMPPDLLTASDEERVVARQSSAGRMEAARLLLAIMTQRGDWVSRLQQGLRHREIRLPDLADKIDALLREVRVEIDFPGNATSELMEMDTDQPPAHGSATFQASHGGAHMEIDFPGKESSEMMEVDADLWSGTTQTEGAHHHWGAFQAIPPTPTFSLPPPQPPAHVSATVQASPAPAVQQTPLTQPHPAAQVGFQELPPGMMSGLSLGGEGTVPASGQKLDIQAAFALITQQFFPTLMHEATLGFRMIMVKILKEEVQRLSAIVLTTHAVGCLELRLSVATSRDLLQLRRLVESGVLQDVVERVVLSDSRRAELKAAAAAHGFVWRRLSLKVTIKPDDLDRCERFLRAREVIANPSNAAEALLQQSAIKRTPSVYLPRHALPELLVHFLQSLLPHHSPLAQKVAAVLATQPLGLAIIKTLDDCRHHFGMTGMEKERSPLSLKRLLRLKLGVVSHKATLKTPAPWELQKHASLYFEPAAAAKIPMKRWKSFVRTDKGVVDGVVDGFVTDFDLTRIPTREDLPEDYVARVLENGSSFAVLHLVNLLLCLRDGWRPDESQPGNIRRDMLRRSISHQLLQCMSDPDRPRAVTDLYLACHSLLRNTDCRPLFQRCWWTFGPEWKRQLRDLLDTDQPDSVPDILLCPVTAGEQSALAETGKRVLSARNTVDLTGRLSGLSRPQVRVVLACVQMTNVAGFTLERVGECAALRVERPEAVAPVTTPSVGQPALMLCENLLEDMQVQCLLEALPGMESVSHFDLTSCTIAHTLLQRLLDGMAVASVRTLVLNKISFSDSRAAVLPRFSHLKGLQAVELSSLGLQDGHMAPLARQLRELHDLRELSLEDTPITTDGLTRLTAALAPCASLRVLRLPGCQLDAGGAFVLGAALTQAVCLHVLNLAQCPLLDSGLQHLSQVLRDHTLLTKVSLRAGRYSPHGLAAFLAHLSRCPRMQVLELGQCPLEEEGADVCQPLLRALAGSCQWDFLGLWQCRIGHTTFLQQLHILPTQLRGLTQLVLQDNNIDDAQAGHLAEAVRRGVFRHLKILNLSQNNIQEAGAKELAEALHRLPHLARLLMQHSAIPVQGAVSLARAVLRLPDMTLLDLSDSCGMGLHDVSDAVTIIGRIVQTEEIVMGLGVKYPDGDSALEQTYLAEKLRVLCLKETLPRHEGEEGPQKAGKPAEEVAPHEPPSTQSLPAHLPRKKASLPSTEEAEEIYGDTGLTTHEVVAGKVYDDPGLEVPYGHFYDVVTSPTEDQPALRWSRSGRREITGRDGDALYFNQKLWITLVHH